ncbi:electron transfer flavoprotein subunit beta [Vogesella sp. GCM10023246]|uniref:Electron transfer flavoprotein subunit beta n=1 Tax=Vogesella oryzagri TaxID=3160864 RepID=A0ABV1M448_9NEIS
MSKQNLKVAVLLAPGTHPVSGRPCAAAADSAALALAMKLVPSPQHLLVLYAGDADDSALAPYLAQGVSCVNVLPAVAGADVSRVLARQLQDVDLVLCGRRAGGGQGSAMLPYLLAEELEAPLLPDALQLKVGNGQVEVEQYLPKGQRRQLAAALPAIVSVHERASAPLPYAHARLQQGQIRHLSPANLAPGVCHLEPANRRARPLVAASKASGHERMLGAIASDGAKAGGVVVKQGDPVEKAQVLLDYLRDHHLVDF